MSLSWRKSDRTLAVRQTANAYQDRCASITHHDRMLTIKAGRCDRNALRRGRLCLVLVKPNGDLLADALRLHRDTKQHVHNARFNDVPTHVR